MEGLTEGRNVHYVAYNNRHLAAIIIGMYQDDNAANLVDLAVFSNMPNVNGGVNMGLTFQAAVPYDSTKKPGSWHWIERISVTG